MKKHTALTFSVLALYCFAFQAAAQSTSPASCAPPLASKIDSADTLQITIDFAWSGASTRFAAIAHKNKIYVGYYDPDRWLTVAQVDPKTGRSCKVRLNSRFAGWDAHNYVLLSFDHAGVLHVAANMHATQLVYGRADAPNSLDGLRLRSMVGRQEQRVTYPNFVKIENRFLFLYRDGVSGDGVWFANSFEGGVWRRVGSGPIFDNVWKGKPISAYPTSPEIGPDGIAHFAIVWRRNPDVISNVAISYVATRDFKTFMDARGQLAPAPVGPESGDIIDAPGVGGGLLNARISLDRAGQPAIVYHRYGLDGRNEVVVAKFGAGGWSKSPIAIANKRTVYEGRGTLPEAPVFSPVISKGGKTFIQVKFTGEPWRLLMLDPATLAPSARETSPPAGMPPAYVPALPGLRAPNLLSVTAACDETPQAAASAILSYIAQAPNRDRVPDCQADANACTPPPSPLILKIANRGEDLCSRR